MTIRVLIADDHPIFLGGLEQLIASEPNFELVAKCGDPDLVLPTVLEHSPDVILLDLQMPKKNGLMLMRELLEAGVKAPVVMLTGSINDDEVMEALRLRVRGILLKELAPAQLFECLSAVHAGGQWIEKSTIARALEKMLRHEQATQAALTILTKPELDVVRMVATGLPNKEIAAQLTLTEGAVKAQLHTIFQKLQLSNRVELTVYAREKGLV